MSDPRAEWSFLARRVVMVGRFSERDGIARYADQLMRALGDGREFLRVGIPEGPGDRARALHEGGRALGLLRDTRGWDEVLVQWHPDYYVRGGFSARLATIASWAVLARSRPLTVVVHEPDPGLPAEVGRRGRLEFRVLEAVRRRFWRGARRLVFHSEWERDRLRARFGTARRREDVVVSHGSFFTPAAEADSEQARRLLEIDPDRALLLLIGFFSARDPDKGYDRAIAAMADIGGADLWIVGSPIREDTITAAHVGDLRRAAQELPNVHLREGFVDDETFDLWIHAADAVLAPYRTASSSGVVARARLLGTPVIASSVGGLAEQAGPGDAVVRDDASLAFAMRQVAAGRART